MAFTFKGGCKLNEHKNTAKCAITPIAPPHMVYIPMSQHIGAHCTPLVKVGDRVNKGQSIGQVEAGLGCPVHSPVSGTVKEIRSVNNAAGIPVKTVVIENDFENRPDPSVQPCQKAIGELTNEEIIERIKSAGISGMGGATFPTYAKIASAIGKVNRLIINCAECEPYITANHRLMLEHPERIIGGIKILLKVFSLRTAIIAIENNKMDAAKKIASLDYPPEMIKICMMKTKYPQGDERQLIYALTGKELPQGKLPADLGCVIFNAETCAAIYNAFSTGMPLIERIVTVDGDCIKKPSNLLCPIGTPFSELIRFCGGEPTEVTKLISGGPMMGHAQWDVDAPVSKGCSAILAFSEKYEKKGHLQRSACIRCGKCVENCPMHLLPRELYIYTVKKDLEKCEKLNVTSCVECGTCSYNCPARLELTQYIRASKSKVIEQQKRAAAAAKAKATQEEKEERK